MVTKRNDETSATASPGVQAANRRAVLQAATVASLGSIVLAGCDGGSSSPGPIVTPAPTPTPTPTPTPASLIGSERERDLLNLALNVFYLEGQFLSVALTGQGLDAALLTGTGVPGTASGGRLLTISDAGLAERFREIRFDTLAHIALMRELLGAAAVAQPAIALGASGGPFGQIGIRAGFSGPFDPYADDASFLLGAFYLVETSVSLLKRLAWQMDTSQVLADAVTGIFAAKSYHAGMIRLGIYRRGVSSADLIDRANRISDFRDSLNNTGVDLDQGVTVPPGVNALPSNINLLPSSPKGYLLERTPREARSLLYLTQSYVEDGPAITGGGFFPNGVNGNPARP